ncbi:MAG: tetratricopeptide repeat protein [Limisphaerales bacterium]
MAGEVAAVYPDDPLTSALLGSAYYNTGKSTEATQFLRKCLSLNPKQTDAYEILARIAYEKGDPEEAVRLGRDALKYGPPSSTVLNSLGRALMDLGKSEEAVESLQRATRLPHAPAESHYLLGQALLQSGNPAAARDSFLTAIRLVPDHTQAVFGLVSACQRLGNTEETQLYRKRFQELETQDRAALSERSAQEDTRTGLPLVRQTVARTLLGAAQIHRAHQQPAKAAALFLRAAHLDPDQTECRAALEGHYVRTQSVPDGVKTFAELVSQQPGNPLNHASLGRLQARLGQVDAAESSFRKVQELAPAWSEGYRGLAELYLRANRHPAEAAALAQKAADLAPTAPHFHLLAAVLAENADLAGAVDAMKRAIALDPNRPLYRDFLKKLQELKSQ